MLKVMLKNLCKKCGLVVDTFVKTCQKLFTISKQWVVGFILLWTTLEKSQLFHKTIHIAIASFLSVNPFLYTISTEPITTTKLYRKGTL